MQVQPMALSPLRGSRLMGAMKTTSMCALGWKLCEMWLATEAEAYRAGGVTAPSQPTFSLRYGSSPWDPQDSSSLHVTFIHLPLPSPLSQISNSLLNREMARLNAELHEVHAMYKRLLQQESDKTLNLQKQVRPCV